MENYLASLIGGVVIGLAATIMLLFNGKITGISGIVSNVLSSFNRDGAWRYTFLVGLVIGGLFMKANNPEYFNYTFDTSYLEVIIAGLFVGIGTLLGSGCTSGHGVCGIPRLSPRSIVATCTFISAGILTVLIRSLI